MNSYLSHYGAEALLFHVEMQMPDGKRIQRDWSKKKTIAREQITAFRKQLQKTPYPLSVNTILGASIDAWLDSLN